MYLAHVAPQSATILDEFHAFLEKQDTEKGLHYIKFESRGEWKSLAPFRFLDFKSLVSSTKRRNNGFLGSSALLLPSPPSP